MQHSFCVESTVNKTSYCKANRQTYSSILASNLAHSQPISDPQTQECQTLHKIPDEHLSNSSFETFCAVDHIHSETPHRQTPTFYATVIWSNYIHPNPITVRLHQCTSNIDIVQSPIASHNQIFGEE